MFSNFMWKKQFTPGNSGGEGRLESSFPPFSTVLHSAVSILYQTVTEEEPMNQERGDNKNLLPAEETYCKKGVTEAIHKTLHKKKRRQVHQSCSLVILPYRYST